MGQYLLRRVAISIPVLIGITLATYLIVNLAPGDPITALISPEAAASLGPEWVAQQREALGLNQPLPVRYGLWLKEVATGNLGFSLQDRQPIAGKILERIWPTFRLMGSSVGLVAADRGAGRHPLRVAAILRARLCGNDLRLHRRGGAGVLSWPRWYLPILAAARLATHGGDEYGGTAKHT